MLLQQPQADRTTSFHQEHANGGRGNAEAACHLRRAHAPQVNPLEHLALASAAAVLLFVVTRERAVPTVRTRPADATPVVVARPPETVNAPIPTRTARTTTSVRRVASSLYAMPDPEPLEVPADLRERATTMRASEPAFDGVSASSNGSVTVLKTSNPKITVIWFK